MKVGNYDFECDLAGEVNRARSKFPSNEHLMLALMEEVGELAKALLEIRLSKATSADVYAEAVQVACVAMRIATEGDPAYPAYDPDKGYCEFGKGASK